MPLTVLSPGRQRGQDGNQSRATLPVPPQSPAQPPRKRHFLQKSLGTQWDFNPGIQECWSRKLGITHRILCWKLSQCAVADFSIPRAWCPESHWDNWFEHKWFSGSLLHPPSCSFQPFLGMVLQHLSIKLLDEVDSGVFLKMSFYHFQT